LTDETGPNWRSAPDVPLDLDGPDIDFAPFDLGSGPETAILSFVVAQAERRPDHLAIVDDHRSLTWRELIGEAFSLGAAIAAVAAPGQAVGIRLPDRAEGPIAMLACLVAATPAVLMDNADPPERAAKLIAESRLAALITDSPQPGLTCIAPGGHPPASHTARALEQGAPAFIVWTSGSSGQPKGIVHSQRSVLFRAGLLVCSGHLNASDRYLSLNSPPSMGALLNAVAAWLAGATLHRVDLAASGLGGILRRIRRHRITAVIGVPAIYRALTRLSAARSNLESLRLVSSNGEALLAADLEQLRRCLPAGCHVQMVYGATETQAGMRIVPRDEIPAEAQVAAGRPISGTEYAIVREDGVDARPGETGELLIRSRYTAIGEWRDGRRVDGRLLPDGPAGSGLRRYAMGDLVRQRPDGIFVVVGRIDRQLKLNGYRVEPVEIEAVLRTDPGVVDASVLPVQAMGRAELVAFVATGKHENEESLRRRLGELIAANMPPQMRPRRLHLMQRLPLLSGNKVDAGALQRLDQQGFAET
jgi:acyl-coenzyme A synthetase/AMP-(fatty) acid ligase